jgi:hypothetical protein
MTTERETEAILSPQDIQAILSVCSSEGVLVGGQALAFWADRYGVVPPVDLGPAVTAYADFIGDAALAKKLARALGWKSWIPSFDDATFQTGKVTQKQRDGSIKQVDFLASVAGLATKDVTRRALEMQVPRVGALRIMHPVDVLDSRIQNLHLIPAKRTPAGVAQARLAIGAARAFIAEEIQERGEKQGLKLLERVVEIAFDIGAVRIYLEYDIDPLAAVPLDSFKTTTALHSKRWPQITARVSAQREKIRRLHAPAPRSSKTS